MPTSYIELHASNLDLNYANRVPYEVSGLVYWLDPQRWNDPAAPWTMNGSKVVAAPSRHSSLGLIDATKTAAQGTDAQRPTLNTSDAAYGGRATLSFSSAASQYLATGAWGAAATQPTTIYVVGECGAGASQYLVDGIATGNRNAIIANGATTNPAFWGGSSVVAGTSSLAVSAQTVVCGVFNGASSALYERGPATAAASGSIGTNSLTGITIGSIWSIGNCLNGKIATVLVYSGAHDEATRTRIMQWLEDRYGFNRSLTPYLVGGLAYWLDPDRYADPSGPGAWTLNGTKVATAVSRHSWAGVADTSKNVTQATDGNRPTLNVADGNFNGKNTLSFSYAASQILRAATTTAIPAPQTVYVVASSTGTTADTHRATNFDASGTFNKGSIYQAITTGLGVARGTSSTVNSTTAIGDSVNRVYCGVFNGASSGLYINNATTGWTGTTGSDTFDGISIGGLVSSQTWDGKITTVLVYSGAHTAAQRALIMQWLGSRYGVPVT